jgi:hypothetical protein
MRDRQKDSAKKALRDELKTESSIEVEEFSKNELDLNVFKNTDSSIPLDEYNINDAQYAMLVKKMKYERIGYYIRIVSLVGIVLGILTGVYMLNQIVFRLIMVTTVLLIIILFNSKEMRNMVFQPVDKNNLRFIQNRQSLKFYIGIVSDSVTIKNDITAVYFKDKYILLKDIYSLWSFDKDDVVIVIYNTKLDEVKIRDVEDTFKVKVNMKFNSKELK